MRHFSKPKILEDIEFKVPKAVCSNNLFSSACDFVRGGVYSRICERVLDTDGYTALPFKKNVSETGACAYSVTETVWMR